jgi:hypothetical protein
MLLETQIYCDKNTPFKSIEKTKFYLLKMLKERNKIKTDKNINLILNPYLSNIIPNKGYIGI